MEYMIEEPLLFGTGAVMALLGFFVWWFSVRLAGAYLGGISGGGLGALAAALLQAPELTLPLMLGGGLLGGLIGLWIVKKLDKMAFFILGSFAGMGAGRPLAFLLGVGEPGGNALDQPPLFWITVVAAAGVGGIFALFGRRYLMIILTASIGVLLMGASLDPFPPRWLYPLALLLAGGWQIALLRLFSRKKKKN